jgi:hypothetical protein
MGSGPGVLDDLSPFRERESMKVRIISMVFPAVVAAAFAAGPAVSTAGAAASADVAVSHPSYVAVRNNGTSTAYNVKVTYSWAGGVDATFVRFYSFSTNNEVPISCITPPRYSFSRSGGVTCTMPSLGPGQQEALYLSALIASLGSRWSATFTVTATSSTPDPNLANNTVSWSVGNLL